MDYKTKYKMLLQIRDISTYYESIKDDISKSYKLSSIQATILIDIYNNGNMVKITDICKRLHKKTNSISPLIDRLIIDGYIIKEKSEKDKRITYVSLTKKAIDVTNNVLQDLFDYILPLYDKFSEQELLDISKHLDKITSIII